MITVNIFFAHWIKERDIKRYGDDSQIVLTNTKMSTAIPSQCQNI